MTLKQALRDQILALGYTGAIFFGSTPSGTDDSVLIREEGEHDADPARIRIHPRISLFIRGRDRVAVGALARQLYDFFHNKSPLVLASGYRISRSTTSGLPRDLGQDGANLWRRSIDLLITQPKHTQL